MNRKTNLLKQSVVCQNVTCPRVPHGDAKEQALSIKCLYGLFYAIPRGMQEQDCFDIPQVCLHTPSNKLSTSKDHYSLPPPNA